MDQHCIIFLNGTSSSGKTSIVKEIVKRYSTPLLEVSVDNLFNIIPNDLMGDDPFIHYGNPPMITEPNSHNMPKNKFIDLMNLFPKYISGYHQSIDAFYSAGCNIIVDHVLQHEDWYKECIQLFKHKRAYFIGIHCPLHVINQREKKRGDRPIGMAEYQFNTIHGKNIYDYSIDTSVYTPEECAENILSYIRANPTPTAFKTLSTLY